MNEREFCYWLQGLFEVSDVKSLDERQVKIIKDHLALVFKKVTPDRPINTWSKPDDFWRPYQGATCAVDVAGVAGVAGAAIGAPDLNVKSVC